MGTTNIGFRISDSWISFPGTYAATEIPLSIKHPPLPSKTTCQPLLLSSTFGTHHYAEMHSASFVSIFLALMLPSAFAANAFLASTLGSHMVLQRGVSSSVYGWSSVPSSTVTVTMGTSTYSATSSPSPSAAGGFFWQVALPAMAASLVGTDIQISSNAGEAATLSDVLFGDVFFCSGQSNMQFAMPGVLDAEQQIARADNYSAIRIFDVGQDMNQPQSVNPLDDLFSLRRGWTVSSLLSPCCTPLANAPHATHAPSGWKRCCRQQRRLDVLLQRSMLAHCSRNI